MRYFVILMICVWFSPAQAFNFQSHRLICQMAYDQLSSGAQQRVDALIAQSPYSSFAEACPWPDSIRQEKSYKHTSKWHYINVARGAKQVQSSDCPAVGCLLSALSQQQQKLTRSPNQDWQALLFVSHLLADLHQPMHVSYADDLGGNKTQVTKGKRSTNLHALWDGYFLKRIQVPTMSAKLNAAITPAQRLQWQQGNFRDWANESLQLTRDAYRLIPPSHKINDKYIQFFAPKLEERMQQASVRLAILLEEIYK